MSHTEVDLRTNFLTEPSLARSSRTSAAQARRPDIDRSYVIPVLNRALVIMKLLGRANRPMTVAQVCQATGFPKTTVYRILRTLSAFGYIPQGSDGVYSFAAMSFRKEVEPDPCRSVSM